MQQIKREGSIQGEGWLYKKLKIPSLPPKLPRSGVTFHFTVVETGLNPFCFFGCRRSGLRLTSRTRYTESSKDFRRELENANYSEDLTTFNQIGSHWEISWFVPSDVEQLSAIELGRADFWGGSGLTFPVRA